MKDRPGKIDKLPEEGIGELLLKGEGKAWQWDYNIGRRRNRIRAPLEAKRE